MSAPAEEATCKRCGHAATMHAKADGRVTLMGSKKGERPCLKGVFSSVDCKCKEYRPAAKQ